MLKKISKNKFIRNVIMVATGTAGAQLLKISLTPIITRIYGPEAFGILGVFLSIIIIMSPIAAMTYPNSIVLPKLDRDAKGIAQLSLYITLIFALIVLFIILIFNNLIIKLFGLRSIAPYLYLIPFAMLFSGFSQVMDQWIIRTKQFSLKARATFLSTLILDGSKIGVGIVYPWGSILIIIATLGQILNGLIIFIGIRSPKKKMQKRVRGPIEIETIKSLAKKYKEFPIYRAPQLFINSVTQGVPILMLSSLFGPAAAGFYSLGRQVLNVPSQLLGNSVGDVFYPRISEAANNGENLSSLIRKATLYLGLAGVLPYGIVFLFGPTLFGMVFGEEWIGAGEYARWITLWIFFMFINQPSVRALQVMSAQAFHLRFTVISLLIRLAFLGAGYFIYSSDLVAIALFSISGGILSFSLVIITLRISRQFDVKNKI